MSTAAKKKVHHANASDLLRMIRAMGSKEKFFLAFVGKSGKQFKLDLGSYRRQTLDLLKEIIRGGENHVERAEYMSTQEAADILNVSRPFVAKLIDQGQLPAMFVGKHRRVLRQDVLAFCEKMKRNQNLALDKLTKESEELGLYTE